MTAQPASHTAEALPAEQLNSILALPEPARAKRWYALHFDIGPQDAEILQTDLWQQYKADFYPFQTKHPLMVPADLIKLASGVFYSAAADHRTTAMATKIFVIRGLKWRAKPPAPKHYSPPTTPRPDLVLVSGDNVTFRVASALLRIRSGHFEDLFANSLRFPVTFSRDVDGLPALDVSTASARTLDIVLPYVASAEGQTPILLDGVIDASENHLLEATVQDIMDAWKLVEAWRVPSAQQALRTQICHLGVKAAYHEGLQIYLFGRRLKDDIITAAARPRAYPANLLGDPFAFETDLPANVVDRREVALDLYRHALEAAKTAAFAEGRKSGLSSPTPVKANGAVPASTPMNGSTAPPNKRPRT